jgi:hypothetical protein
VTVATVRARAVLAELDALGLTVADLIAVDGESRRELASAPTLTESAVPDLGLQWAGSVAWLAATTANVSRRSCVGLNSMYSLSCTTSKQWPGGR